LSPVYLPIPLLLASLFNIDFRNLLPEVDLRNFSLSLACCPFMQFSE
jgi:hypothetical protein